jgi:hypothetical protein
MLAVLDLDAGRLQDAAAHLREVLQYITRAVDRVFRDVNRERVGAARRRWG